MFSSSSDSSSLDGGLSSFPSLPSHQFSLRSFHNRDSAPDIVLSDSDDRPDVIFLSDVIHLSDSDCDSCSSIPFSTEPRVQHSIASPHFPSVSTAAATNLQVNFPSNSADCQQDTTHLSDIAAAISSPPLTTYRTTMDGRIIRGIFHRPRTGKPKRRMITIEAVSDADDDSDATVPLPTPVPNVQFRPVLPSRHSSNPGLDTQALRMQRWYDDHRLKRLRSVPTIVTNPSPVLSSTIPNCCPSPVPPLRVPTNASPVVVTNAPVSHHRNPDLGVSVPVQPPTNPRVHRVVTNAPVAHHWNPDLGVPAPVQPPINPRVQRYIALRAKKRKRRTPIHRHNQTQSKRYMNKTSMADISSALTSRCCSKGCMLNMTAGRLLKARKAFNVFSHYEANIWLIAQMTTLILTFQVLTHFPV